MTPVAIFDLDETLIDGNAGVIFIRHLYFGGIIKGRYRKIIPIEIYKYITGAIGEDRMVELGSECLEGIHKKVLEKEAQLCFEQRLLNKIDPAIQSILKIHQNLGHITILASGSPIFIADAVGKALGFDYILASRPIINDEGICTNKIDRPLCYKEGKLHRVSMLFEELGLSRWSVTFYSDSPDDMPLLTWVINPCVVKPSKEMELISRREGFYIIG